MSRYLTTLNLAAFAWMFVRVVFAGKGRSVRSIA